MLLQVLHDNDYVDKVPSGCYSEPEYKDNLEKSGAPQWKINAAEHYNIRIKIENLEELIRFMKNCSKESGFSVSFNTHSEEYGCEGTLHIHDD